MTLPAFGSFFLAEDFVYLSNFYARGSDFWHAAFSPMAGIFFRPLFFIVSVPWQFVLPREPVWFHARNLLLAAVNIFLLYRILVRLVPSMAARVAALALFVVSKIHFQTIGFVGVYESVVSLMLLLATVLFFLRYVETKRTVDYALGLLVCALSVCTKDYGLVVIFVVLALIVARSRGHASARAAVWWWAPRLAPLPIMAVAYLAARYLIVGPPPSAAANAAYAPQLIPTEVAYKVLVFTATVGNVAFGSDGATGSGVGPALLRFAPGLGAWAGRVDVVLYVALLGLLVFTAWRARDLRRDLLLPLVWIGAYFGPTLLVRNEQMYYMYEPMAGTAILLGLCLERGLAGLRRLWAVALVVIGALGLLSNYTSLYTWQYAATGTQQIRKPVVEGELGKPLDSLTFVTDSPRLWRWSLTADGLGTLIPYLLDQPRLKVEVLSYYEAGTRTLLIDERNPVFDIDNAFQPYNPFRAQVPLTLRGISPTQAVFGEHFNIQPNGESAIAAAAEGAKPTTVIVINGTPLPTTFITSTYVSALVPDNLLAAPGTYQVYLDDGGTQSEHLTLVVAEAPAAH